MEKKIRIKVDQEEQGPSKNENFKSARTSLEDLVSNTVSKTVEFEMKAISKNLSDTYGMVIEMINNLPQDDERLQLETINFSLVFDSTGQVNIFSAVSGELKTQAGLSFTISNKRKNEK